GLAAPDLQTGVVDDVEQRLNAVPGKAAAEVPRRGGVGDTARAQGVQHDLVVAEQFQVLQAGAAAQRQIGQREHVVRFVIGQVDLQQLQAPVDGVDEAEPTGEGVEETDAAAGNAAGAAGNFVTDVAGGHHGPGAATQVFLVQ